MRSIENYLQFFFSYGFYNDKHQTESNPNQSARKTEKKQNLQRVFSSFNIIIKTIMASKLQKRTAWNGNRKWRENLTINTKNE